MDKGTHLGILEVNDVRCQKCSGFEMGSEEDCGGCSTANSIASGIIIPCDKKEEEEDQEIEPPKKICKVKEKREIAPPNKIFEDEDKWFLRFIYSRLKQVHGENPNVDYMLKLALMCK